MLSSKGAAGVTGSGFITLAATLSVVPTVPVAGMALILGVDRFMSECRALTNIVGNAVAAVVVARWEGALDEDRLRAALAGEPAAGAGRRRGSAPARGVRTAGRTARSCHPPSAAASGGFLHLVLSVSATVVSAASARARTRSSIGSMPCSSRIELRGGEAGGGKVGGDVVGRAVHQGEEVDGLLEGDLAVGVGRFDEGADLALLLQGRTFVFTGPSRPPRTIRSWLPADSARRWRRCQSMQK